MRRVQSVAVLVVLGLSLALPGCGKKSQKSSRGNAAPGGPMDTIRRGPPEHKSKTTSSTLSGPAERLAATVETALKTNRLGPVLALLPTAETAKGCPQLLTAAAKTWGSVAMAVAHTRQRTQKELTHCHGLGDWSSAVRVKTQEHHPSSKPVQGCKRLLIKGRIDLTYRLGKTTVVVELPGPALRDGKSYVLLDGVRCRKPLR